MTEFLLIIIRMAQPCLSELFACSTQTYCRDDYNSCLALLNNCINMDPNLSVLYSNRAITRFHLQQHEGSEDDLAHAIKINPLDYIAHFNSFSLRMLHGESDGAFNQLCLSLSGAYLALGKVRREQEWLSKAIQYASNNKQALLLRGLYALERGEKEQAHADIMQAYDYEVRSQQSLGIKHILTTIANQYQLPLPPDKPRHPQNPYVLRTTHLSPPQTQLSTLIKNMLDEFNQIYQLINSKGSKEEQDSKASLSQAHSRSASILDKQSKNQSTTLAEGQNEDPAKETSNLTTQSRNKELRIHSRITPQPYLTQQRELCREQEISGVRFFVDGLYLAPELHSPRKIYTLLCYNGVVFRSSLAAVTKGVCNWSEWSQKTPLSSIPGKIRVRVMQPSLTSFRQKCLGVCEWELMATGPQQIQLRQGDAIKGVLLLTIQPQF